MFLIHVSGCGSLLTSNRATLTVYSQPEGAFLTEVGGGVSGVAPLIVLYDPSTLLQNRDADGCFRVRGFEARWVSGVATTLAQTKFCGSERGAYQITFTRDASQAGLEKDMQFALQIQAVRAQQQQAQAAQDAADAAESAAIAQMFSTWSTPKPIKCESTQAGSTVRTTCR